MDYIALGFLVYVLGYLVGYFTGHTIALNKVQVALAKSRQRTVEDLYGNRNDKSN